LEDGGVLIAGASATASSGPYAIVVWKWGANQKAGDQDVDGRWTTWKVIGFLMKVVVVIAALAYFVELIRTTVRNGNPSTVFCR
jgi:disulfide bond formation protein DsbB